MKLIKNFFVGFSICALSVGQIVWAQGLPGVDDSLSAFRNVALVSPVNSVVPIVVEVPVNQSQTDRGIFLIEQVSDGTQLPYYWYAKRLPTTDNLKVKNSAGLLLAKLVDDNPLTSETFPLAANGYSEVTLNLTIDNPTAISGVSFDFGENVELPLSVSVTTLTEEGDVIAVRARSRMTAATTNFPSVTTNNLQVTLVYAQPLRIDEINVNTQNKTIVQKSGLRFLAQPKESYRIYTNPDRSVPGASTEMGDLRQNDGVLLLSAVSFLDNSLYQPVDADHDGILDVVDNCTVVPNPDQADLDNNGVGDLCDDYDRDGIINIDDNCPNLPNQQQYDEDADGIGDVCDDEESRLTEKYSWILWVGLGVGFVIMIALFAVVLRRETNIK